MARSKKINKECECCGKKLKEVFPLTKYCSRCSIFTNKLRSDIKRLENKIEKMMKWKSK